MIVIPMAGLSRRFTDAGYLVPKYMLQARGYSLFRHSVLSFAKYFNDTSFLFVARDVNDTVDFIHSEVKSMGIQNYQVVNLLNPTAGQAETVYLGLTQARVNDLEPITIFNIDTFRPHFEFPTEFNLFEVAGYLEVFRGHGDNWSYVKADSLIENRVIETAEKIQISDLCCTGLYHFGSVSLFREAYLSFLESQKTQAKYKEHFIAPIYNQLIARNLDVRFTMIDGKQVIFCGVPSEYLDFLES